MSITKVMVMMVGSQGSGKTTHSKTLASGKDSIRISQDDLGKRQHFIDYEKALKEGIPNIVVDKIGNTKEMRRLYLEPAKAAGYQTYIVDITNDPVTCFNRITAREDHPTIPKGDERLALKVLFQYYRQYQEPSSEECHHADVSLRKFSPYMLDLTHLANDKRFIIIGDVHGCFDEVLELLDEVCYDPISDVVVFAGDLVDRGPKIKEILEFVRDNDNVYSVLGNHDDKFLRYLVGNKVNPQSLSETITQTKKMDQVELALFLMSLPLMIKIGDAYVIHAGINPNRSMNKQKRESLIYARHFDPDTGGFDEKAHTKYWFDYPIKDPNATIYFGHHYHEDVQVAEKVVSLDGHCVYGGKLRGFVTPDHLVEVDAKEAYVSRQTEDKSLEALQPYEDRITSGYIKKQTKGNLVIYNYTDKCTFDRAWDEYTLQARGLIYNKITGELLAQPFKKFFNINEMPETQLENLPDEEYDCFDKMDGSLGILYRYHGDHLIATRGSFESPQAHIGTSILHDKGYAKKMNDFLPPTVTLLFEIVYPSNRFNSGARLVLDYGETRDLFLLAAYDFQLGAEYSRELLEKTAKQLGMPIAKKYDLTIKEMIELKKTMPADREGFVVRFRKSGLRVKIKGEEYLKMHKVLNSITPLFFWEQMKMGQVPESLIQMIPEEFRNEGEELQEKLETLYYNKMQEIDTIVENIYTEVGKVLNPHESREYRKKIGLHVSKKLSSEISSDLAAMVFPFIYHNMEAVDRLIHKAIRPKGNML